MKRRIATRARIRIGDGTDSVLRRFRKFFARKLWPSITDVKSGQPFDPHNAFRTARAFEEVGRVICASIEAGNPHLPALVLATNLAFSLETYLKCLLALEQNILLDGHDSEELFRNLKKQTKEALRKFHRDFVKDKEPFETFRLRGWKVDLDSLLARGKDSFVAFRYTYERLPVETDFALGPLILGVQTRILKIHPEWGNLPSVDQSTSRAR